MKYIIEREDKEILRGFTNAKIAELTGLSQAYISLLRRGKRRASEKTYKMLKEILDI